jgi:hypothetical protein
VANERVTFTSGSADRIAKVVRIVEAGNRDATGYVAGPRLQGGGKVFRVCKFTGSWSLNAAKNITFLNQTATPNTVVAQNIFATISGTTATATFRNCAIAKDGTAWYLIAAQC